MCFADQDDIWFSNKLLHAHEVIVSTGADAYSSNVIAFWPDGHQSLIEKSQAQRKWDYLFEAAGPGCTYVIKKELALAIQGLIKNHWDKIQQMGLHDWFSYAFARANNYSWVIDDYVGMNYRQHEKNQIGVNSGWRAFAYRCYKVLNGWGLRQSVLIACLLDLENEPFVKRWSKGSRIGLLWLALHSNQCRRRFRDRWFFAFSCLALFFVGERKK
jgi:rhamnosyltransferase